MPSFDSLNLSVHYHDTGHGEPIALLHAGGSSGRQWDKVCALCPDRYRFLAPDLIGFGKTQRWPGPGDLTHDHQADLVLALLKRVCDRPVHLVGHSYGGSTAMRFALAHPHLVSSLVLIEPNVVSVLPDAGEHELFETYERIAKAFMDDVAAGRQEAAWNTFIDLRNGAGAWDAMSDASRARTMDRTGQMVDGFKSNLNNTTTLSECRTLRVPTMVVCGADTTQPEKRITEILSENLPRCRYETIAGAGHMSPLTHPSDVAALLRSHVAAHEDAYTRCA